MSKQQHTPGPWFVGSQNDALYITSGKPPAQSNDYPDHDADREVIAKMFGSYPISDANARLIAAAAELLEALIELRGACVAAGWLTESAHIEHMDNARAAIAKATGA